MSKIDHYHDPIKASFPITPMIRIDPDINQRKFSYSKADCVGLHKYLLSFDSDTHLDGLTDVNEMVDEFYNSLMTALIFFVPYS